MEMFKQDDEFTPVVFRKMRKNYGDEIIALFVAESFASQGYDITCYAHVGQHGAADYHHIVAHSRPAAPEEYADLKQELEGAPYGYRLKIYQKQTSQHRDTLRAWREEVRHLRA